MFRRDSLSKASHELLGAEVRFNTIAIQIDKIDRELAMLLSVEISLEQNIRLLKRRKLVVLAVEYKKAKTDLKTVRSRQLILKNERNTILLLKKSAERVLNKAREKHEIALDLLNNPPPNVIKFRR
jgi:hypothetical protein